MKPAATPPGQDWLDELAASQRAPTLALALHEAMAHRLRRNYCWIFLILLLAWLLKISGPITVAGIWSIQPAIPVQASVGWTPSWAVLTAVSVFYGWLAHVMIRYRAATVEAFLREV